MTLLHTILEHNRNFVETKQYELLKTSKYPDKKLVIVSCMDTRLVELLPKALNVGNGDVKIIKTAGAVVSHPFGSVMRSVLIAVYELNANEVCIIGHHDCGMASLKSANIVGKIKDAGISEVTLQTLGYAGININKWLHGFDCVNDSVRHSTQTVRNHPLFPKEIPVHGLVINPESGELDVLEDGYTFL